ncbi:MAG: helix-hairpin-helix domain-containing protein, partial [Acidimicrobiales bacterium]|nr:helix-hairpin-helix domain-containing protein [Acidimicrobiales bacterium]
TSSTTAMADVVVAAAGAVRSPGLYRLAPGSRVDDLIRAANGLSADADHDRINLATVLVDGERIWIPTVGAKSEPEVIAGLAGPSESSGTSQGSGTKGGTTSGGLVNLNTADEQALDTLPGVGPATASAIIAYRQSDGPFGSVDDLLNVRGIGEAKLEQLRPLVTV